MAYENLCMYCFEDNGGNDVCPHCGRDARAAVPQIQLLPGTLVYHDRFLIGRALGQDASGIVYAALDTKRGTKIRIREYLPRDSARRLNSGEVVPEPGAEDAFEAGLQKLRASVEEVEDPAKRHFFFEENGTGYIAQRKNAAASGEDGREEGDRRGAKMALVVGVAAVLVLAVAVGVIALVNYFTNAADKRTDAPRTTGEDIWQPPVSPSPPPYAAATFGALTDPTHSWMDFTNPDLSGDPGDYATPTPAPTPEGNFDISNGISARSDPAVIKKLQTLLSNLGWLDSGNITGKYDSATQQAVKDFQQYMNDTYAIDPKLTVDGKAGPKTLSWLLRTDIALKPTPTPAPITPSPTQAGKVIDENASAEEIKYVQLQLVQLGAFDRSQVDGKYGKNTRAAVQKFQQRVNDLVGYDLLREDGTCDDVTLAYLEYYVDWWQKNQPTPAPTQAATPVPTARATASPIEGAVIDENSKASEIKAVQQMLIATGYLSGKADGAYGEKTYAAVMKFQEEINSRHNAGVAVTGRCDSVTLNYLERYYEATFTPEPTSDSGVSAPTITVSGYERIENDVYMVGEGGVKITWSAPGVKNYAVYLYDANGNTLTKEDKTEYVSLTLGRDRLSDTEAYVFAVAALPENGGEPQVSSVRLQAVNAASTPEPGAEKPEITVSGAVSYSDGVYHLGPAGASISWSAPGVSAYSVYLSDEDSTVLFREQNVAYTGYDLAASDLETGRKYTFSVVAIPEGGQETDGQYASVSLTVDDNATPVPSATPAADFEAPEISISGDLGEMEGVHFVGTDPVKISWYAAGQVRAYSVYLTNAQGDALISQQETDQQSLTVDPASMKEDEVYTITVFAIPEGGQESDGKSAAMQIQLYTGQTPQPTPEPIAEIGPVQITVSGQVAENGGVYYADRDALTVAWSVEGEVTGYNVVVTDSTGATVLEKNDYTKTAINVDPSDMTRGITYTFTVTALPKGGTASDGTSASVNVALYEAPPVGAPEISVTGCTQENGVYLAAEAEIGLSWTAEGAAKYDVGLYDAQTGDALKELKGITDTSTSFRAELLTAGTQYRFAVTAYPDGDGESASAEVLLLRPEAEPTPEPTPEPAPVGVPEIAVSGYLSEDNGVYVVTDTGAAVSWTAEGAAGYDVTIYDYNGDVAKSVKDTTQTTLNVTCDGMTDGDVFTIQVTGKAADGASGESASVQLRYAAPEVTPEPAPEIGLAEIQVQGYTDFDGETYFYGDDGLTLSWSAANAETYDLAVLDASGNVVNSVSATTQTSLSVSAQAANAGQAQTFTVTGRVGDTAGETASVRLMYVSAAPTQEPTAEPAQVGPVSFQVSGAMDVQGDTYYVGDSAVQVSWTAENAQAYNVAVYDESGTAIKSVENAQVTSMTVNPQDLTPGVVYTLAAQGVGADGTAGETAQIRLTVYGQESPDPGDQGKVITPESSSDDILNLQKALYTLGWIADAQSVTPGQLDEGTVQAVYEFQSYVIQMDLNPEITLIDPANPVVDAETVSMLMDTANPIPRPAEN